RTCPSSPKNTREARRRPRKPKPRASSSSCDGFLPSPRGPQGFFRWTLRSARRFTRKRKTMKIGLVSTAVAAVLCASNAYAQEPTPSKTIVTKEYSEQQLEGNQVVTFGDDKLLKGEGGPYGDVIKPPPRVLRVGLIRPRANFVPELLKSVENL